MLKKREKKELEIICSVRPRNTLNALRQIFDSLSFFTLAYCIVSQSPYLSTVIPLAGQVVENQDNYVHVIHLEAHTPYYRSSSTWYTCSI